MKASAVVVVLVLELMATLATAPPVDADPRVHGRGGAERGGGRSFHAHGHSARPRAHSFHKHGFGRHRVFPRHFGGFAVVIAPPVILSSPSLLDVSPPYHGAHVFAPSPVVYGPPAFAPSAPAPPPAPRVVHHLTGRYELRGDGLGTPYTWVWIPNPPPPPLAPPPAPPAAAPDGAQPSAEAPATRPPVYRWVDEQGVVHWTNREETIPRRHRADAQRRS